MDQIQFLIQIYYIQIQTIDVAGTPGLGNTDDSTEIIKLLNTIKLTEDQVIRSYATVTDLPNLSWVIS